MESVNEKKGIVIWNKKSHSSYLSMIDHHFMDFTFFRNNEFRWLHLFCRIHSDVQYSEDENIWNENIKITD